MINYLAAEHELRVVLNDVGCTLQSLDEAWRTISVLMLSRGTSTMNMLNVYLFAAAHMPIEGNGAAAPINADDEQAVLLLLMPSGSLKVH